jgi:protein-tyrosine-phosphatase
VLRTGLLCLMRVLILCTGNAARSQMAEAILRHLSGGRIEVESAGTLPKAAIHPLARETVHRLFGLDMAGQSPKPLDRFLGERFDYVITVCDRAAEACPVFPGAPAMIHWSLEDPAAIAGTAAKQRGAFEDTARALETRIGLWLSQPDVVVAMRYDEASG